MQRGLETYVSAENTTCGPSMLSAEDSPARTLALPEPASAWTETAADYGLSTAESLASYDQSSCSWKTPQLLLTGESTDFWETWPRSGMTRNGTAYRQQPLAPLTSVTEFGYLPTPKASDSYRDFSQETNLLVLWNKETTGLRPSGAKIG